MIKNAVALLAKLKKGELLSGEELSSKLKASPKYFKDVASHRQLAAFRALVRFPSRMFVWGSKKTIKSLKKNHEELLA